MWSFILSLYVDGAPVPPEHYLGTEADVRAWRVWLRALGQRDAPVSEDPFFVSLFGGSGRPYPTDVPVLVPLRRPHVPAARLLPILTAVVECAKLTLASAHMHRAISIGVVGDAAAVELVGRALACADRAPELPILLHEEPLELGFPETPDSLNRQRDCTFALPVFRPDPLGALMQGARGWCLADALDHQEGGHDAPPYVAELRAADVAPGCLLPLLELPDSLVDM
jgi:hypothetical protein